MTHVKTNASGQVCCPRCGSEQLYAAKRGFTLTTGFIGAQRVHVTCLRCGKRSKPGRGGAMLMVMAIIGFILIVSLISSLDTRTLLMIAAGIGAIAVYQIQRVLKRSGVSFKLYKKEGTNA